MSTQEIQLDNKSLSGNFVSNLEYWRKRLANAPPPVELRTDRPRSALQAPRGAREPKLYRKKLALPLAAFAKQQGCEAYAILLAAFQALLARYTEQYDIIIGACAGEFLDGSGWDNLASQVLTRTDLAHDPTFTQLLARVNNNLHDDLAHRGLAPEQIAVTLEPDRNIVNDPPFRILFSAHPSVSRNLSSSHIADVGPSTGTKTSSLDLQIELLYGSVGAEAHLIFNAELFDATTISRFADHFETLLLGAFETPDSPISQLPLLSAPERHQILYEWNNTHSAYPHDACVHQLFEEQARRTPNATAVVFEKCAVTYRVLNERANQIANHIASLGFGPGRLVGICTERSEDMVAALLGTLKAGGAYVPLDPQYPQNRIALMLEDSALSVLITEQKLKHQFADFKGEVICLDSHEISQESGDYCSGRTQPENLAYVIYTSGSTGKPKGVAISHRAVVNFLLSMQKSPGLTAADVLTAVTTTSFDIAGLELYLPLTVGARVVVASRETAVDGYKLRALLSETATTVMQATPATWRLLLEAGWSGEPRLKILCGGEAFPQELVVALLAKCSELWNMYGPTETTIWSTIKHITSAEDSITIGRPIANTFVYVLDSHREPVPVGVPGELYIGGDGVARGYLDRPELTAERFIPNPFREQEDGARMYRTGDLARFCANGEIECLGRIDNQIKIRGFRIDLGDIESAIHEYPGVRQNVVTARDETGDKRLIAYIVPDGQQRFTSSELRSFLKSRLPEYMLPAQFVSLKELPLTPNGKVDRRALPRPNENNVISDELNIAPRNDIEARLLKIWTSVLGIRGIGIRNNFFELGGHSLLVAKLTHRVEQAFGKQLSMAAVFEAPTIEQQAELISNRGKMSLARGLVPVQSRGSSPPLFCLGINCGPMYLPLARYLGENQPLYCVGLTSNDADEMLAPYEMQSVVGRLVAQVRERQPNGPYYLCGCCLGGLLAFEAACQLANQGQEIALLALLEPYIPSACAEYSFSSRFRTACQKVQFHLSNLVDLRPPAVWGYIHDRFLRASLLRLRALQHMLRKQKSRTRDVAEILDLACHTYQPGWFNDRLVLLHATRRQPGSDWELDYWNAHANAVEHHAVPGYSNWVVHSFSDPNVFAVASTLRNYFCRAVKSDRAGQEPVPA